MNKRPDFQAELTVDEFRVVQEAVPDLMLPVSLGVGTLEESGPDVDIRRSAALEALAGRQLLRSMPGGAGDPHPLLLLALGLPSMAVHAMWVQSWTPTESSQTLVSISDQLMSAVTVTVARATDSPQTFAHECVDGRVTISLGSLALLVDHLDGLLAETPLEPVGVRTVTVLIGLVESRTLIAAIRAGDHLVVEQLAAQFGAADAVPVLRSLAATMESGLRLRVFRKPGTPLYSAEWFQGTTGEWVSMRVLANSPGEVTAQTLIDAGQVQVSRRHRSALLADILSVVTTLALEGERVR
ncbi:hypothetical protein E3T39_12550 [Cryobacterium suzukii]|uniref:ESX secretion-associated protein EspG n=1 Tax=Cryobacterium suzukii TaxID=1259198 RepID=A0A4R9AD04_9MICO|nr:hypothetical protein [Cryobacterium suzukii]TFD58130.1 hypothetical protein E3T39_12550 [Cryobacterium suzukii]